MIYDHFRVTVVLMIQFLITLIYSLSIFVTTMFRNSNKMGRNSIICDKDSIRRYSVSLFKMRIRESEQLETVLDL